MKQHKPEDIIAAANKREQNILDGIKAYAEYDKSDPFCYARCMLHHRMGMTAPNDKGEDCHYTATAIPNSEGARLWINVKRV